MSVLQGGNFIMKSGGGLGQANLENPMTKFSVAKGLRTYPKSISLVDNVNTFQNGEVVMSCRTLNEFVGNQPSISDSNAYQPQLGVGRNEPSGLASRPMFPNNLPIMNRPNNFYPSLPNNLVPSWLKSDMFNAN